MAAIMGFESFYERRSVSGFGSGDTEGFKRLEKASGGDIGGTSDFDNNASSFILVSILLFRAVSIYQVIFPEDFSVFFNQRRFALAIMVNILPTYVHGTIGFNHAEGETYLEFKMKLLYKSGIPHPPALFIG